MLSFAQYITETILSIGLNPNHEKFRNLHRDEIHHIIKRSYAKIGGYSGHKSGSPEEHAAIHHDIDHSMIKAVRRGGNIGAVYLYKDKFGRKKIAAGTNGTEQGKKDFMRLTHDDHHQKRAWGEMSGASEHIGRKLGHPVVPNHHAAELTGKVLTPDADGEHYVRKIGGHDHRKVIMGHPKY